MVSSKAIAIVVAGILIMPDAAARRLDVGNPSPLKEWFDGLKSGNGPCCSFADGYAVVDPDWESRDGHYRVRIDGDWIDVPDEAVVHGPNRAGQTMVWPYFVDGHPVIRCFLPGSMT